jgi:branched-chain amino acid transport system permease protein
VVMDRWIFQFPRFSVFGNRFDFFQGGELTVPRPGLFGVSFEGQRAEFILLAAAFAASALVVVGIRRSGFGARLLALKDSPAACATLGMNTTRTKLAVFTLSAALAGFGGAMYGGALRVASAGQFDFTGGLPILLVVVIAGVGLVGGALAAGIVIGSPVLGNLFPHLPQLQLVLSGLAGIGMARSPNGFVLDMRDRWAPVWERPVAAAGVLVALVGVWLLRVSHVIGNWPYALVSLAILAVAPAVFVMGNLRRRDRAPSEMPLEWVGIERPFSTDDGVALDAALRLPRLEHSAVS